MGEQNVSDERDPRRLRNFARRLIHDVRALERMLDEEMFETDTRRIGAEQELFLVDHRGEAAPVIESIMEQNTDPRIVRELTRFNAEFNMDPLVYGGDCFSKMESATASLLTDVRALAREQGAEPILVGILPTAHLANFSMDFMTPKPRYYALNDAITRLRGGAGRYQIRGLDELFVKHDSIMLEGCNTSFQTHFQVTPDEFPRFYNIAQAVAAPCLAASTNSPLLFGKRLWRETRIALFQQAVDTRSSNLYLREMSPRVHFGSQWVQESVTEIFKEDISRFRVLLATEFEDNPLQQLDEGRIPNLTALQLHNGTVYRWNRACYGITDGKPHLRIENRILPSGPTVADEMANAVLWYGLVTGMADHYHDVAEVMDFDDAHHNFIAAARHGLASQFSWIDGSKRPARSLLLETLLPMARDGLDTSGISTDDIDRYLGIIEARVASGQTGSQWQLDSLASMEGGTRTERLSGVTRGMVQRQIEGEPVHTWTLASLGEAYTPGHIRETRVEDYMNTDLMTVHEQESVEFVACMMDWQRLRHVLIEDETHHLVGIISHRRLLRHMAERDGTDNDDTPIGSIMKQDPISVPPDMPTLDAVRLMRKKQIGALPVVREGQLVGIITEREFMDVAHNLLDESDSDGESNVEIAGEAAPPESASQPKG